MLLHYFFDRGTWIFSIWFMHLGQLVFVQTQLFQTRALRIGLQIGATDHIIYDEF